MVTVFNYRSSGPGSSPGWRHCVVFLGKTLNSQGAYLHSSVKLGTGKFNAGGNIPLDQGGGEIFLVSKCYTNKDKLRPDGPLGSYADTMLMEGMLCDFSSPSPFLSPLLPLTGL